MRDFVNSKLLKFFLAVKESHLKFCFTGHPTTYTRLKSEVRYSNFICPDPSIRTRLNFQTSKYGCSDHRTWFFETCVAVKTNSKVIFVIIGNKDFNYRLCAEVLNFLMQNLALKLIIFPKMSRYCQWKWKMGLAHEKVRYHLKSSVMLNLPVFTFWATVWIRFQKCGQRRRSKGCMMKIIWYRVL